MSLAITIELSDDDLKHFADAMKSAQQESKNLSPKEITDAASNLLQDGKDNKLPAFIAERLSKIDSMVAMVNDAGFGMDEEDKKRVLSCLTYFANPKDLKIGPVVGGDAPGAIWLTADLTYTDAGGKPQITRVVELLDGAKGWKIATASIATVKPPTSPATGEAPAMPAPTEPGPLARQLGAPKDLGDALAGADDEPGAGPEAFVVGWQHVADNGGYVNGLMLANQLAKRKVTTNPKVKPHEVRTAAWSYAVADLVVGTGDKAPRATGLAIAIPDAKDATKWVTVAASFNAL